MPERVIVNGAARNLGTSMPKRWTRRAASIAVIAVVVLLLDRGVSSAEPIDVVTSGFYSLSWGEESTLRLVSEGFELFGNAITRDMPLFRCQPCSPGTTIDMGALFTGAFGSGVVGSGGGVFLAGRMLFEAGDVTVPALLAPVPNAPLPSADISRAVTFSALIMGFATEDRSGAPLFTRDLAGRGTATLSLLSDVNGISADHILYQLDAAAPVPEPGTLLLLGSGLAGLVAARRRRHDRETSRARVRGME